MSKSKRLYSEMMADELSASKLSTIDSFRVAITSMSYLITCLVEVNPIGSEMIDQAESFTKGMIRTLEAEAEVPKDKRTIH